MSEGLRLFVALDLPAEVRGALATWAAGAAPEGVRLVPAQNLHLTLAFLGARSRQEADAVALLLAAVCRPLGTLSSSAAMWLPPRRPKVLAAAIAMTPQLEALQASVSAALARAIAYEPDPRRFFPHVTLGRVRRGARIASGDLRVSPALAFGVEALTLYRSLAGPEGSRYEPLASECLR